MRVLQLGKYYYPYMGGMENHLYLLCNELRGRVDLDVVVSNSEARESRDVVEGVSVRRCLTAATVASTALCPTMPLALSRRDYDVLHIHFPHPMGVASYLVSRKPARHAVVITYHSDIVKQERLLKAYAPLMHAVMDRADAIICTSPNYLESSATLQRYAAKCTVVPYGIDLDQFALTAEVDEEAARIRQRFGGPEGAPLLLATGRLIYYKGFEYAVRAMAKVKSNARLLIIGDGPLRRPLEDLARELGVSERVVFVGGVDNREIMAFYRACEIFLLPSIAKSEAFAIVQLEAMACERPVINTALVDSGVPFVSRHEESGLTVAPRDPDALAAAVDRLLENDALRKGYGTAGRSRVQREFTKEVMTKRVLDIYAAAAPR